jgi:hypothetical protein
MKIECPHSLWARARWTLLERDLAPYTNFAARLASTSICAMVVKCSTQSHRVITLDHPRTPTWRTRNTALSQLLGVSSRCWLLLVVARAAEASPTPPTPSGGEEYKHPATREPILSTSGSQGRHSSLDGLTRISAMARCRTHLWTGVVLDLYKLKPKPGSKLRLKLPMVALLAFGMSEFTRVQLVVLTDGFEQRRLYS